MAQSVPAQKSSKKRPPAKKRAKTSPAGKKKRSSRKKKPQKTLFSDFLLISLECLGLVTIGMAAVVVLLGSMGNRFSGTNFMHSLLPFAAGILALIVLASLSLSGWKRLRKWLQARSPRLPAAIMLGATILICSFMPQGYFTQAYGSYRTLVGGKEEAGRVVLAHQVYAAYRRLDIAALQKMISRAEQYSKAIKDAADIYAVDIDLLKGLAAAESSYLPRKSSDGGHGLFQITSIPAGVTKDVNKLFPPANREKNNDRYNAFLGAATLRYYLAQMNDDLFLGLLAYNIGPANGGLRFIMEQYGVTDFTTIQPYLLRLPRDYPIRVLAYALAFRIDHKKGRLLAYAEGKNALAIQAMGIPGQ